MKNLFIFLLLSGSVLATAQDLPATKVFTFRMQPTADGALQLSQPRYWTAFNEGGYNNQPSFLSPTELLLTVGMEGGTQTDIHLIDLVARTRTRLLATGESEYSPRVSADGDYFYAVRVDAETPGLQRLWRFHRQLAGRGEVVLPEAQRVGYYHWLGPQRVAYFDVGTPNTLVVANLAYGTRQRLTPDIGRCFQALPNGDMAYVHKVTPTRWVIKALDGQTLASTTLTETLAGSEDFLVLEDGSLLMGKGSKLFRYTGERWREASDLGRYRLRKITRLARNDRGTLVVVAE